MTLAAYTGPDIFNGDGSTTTFASTFIFWDADDLKVIERTIASGAETALIRGTHYTVTGGSGAVGNVVAVTSPTDYTPSSAVQWIIKSNLSNLQDTQFPLGGPFPSTSAEDQNDKTVRLIQQLREILDRAALLVESTPTSGPLTIPEPSADDVLGWNAGGTDLENKTPNTDTHLTLPAASTDNGVVRYDGATGKAFQDSGVTIDDSDNVVIPGTLGVTGNTTLTGSLTVNNRVIWKKGADIASASPLVLGTDGNYFDVTGTTNFAAITVPAGTLFMLQFDGVLTMTHGASLDLPGEANITTAAGGRLIGFAEAADTVQVLSYFKADGTPLIIGANTIDGTHIAMGSDAQGDVLYYDGTNFVRLAPGTSGQFLKTLGAGANPAWAAAGGGLVWLSRTNASAAAEIAITSADGIDTSLYDAYLLVLDGLWGSTAGQALYMRYSVDDGASYQAGGTAYGYADHSIDWDGLEEVISNISTAQIIMTRGTDAVARALGVTGQIWLPLSASSARLDAGWSLRYSEVTSNDLTLGEGVAQNVSGTVNAIKLYMASGNINGIVDVYGLVKA